MHPFTVALAQYTEPQTVQESLAVGLEVALTAKNRGADLVLFPELWPIGYRSSDMIPTNALALHNNYMQAFCDKAKELNIAIGVPYLGQGKMLPTNNVALIDGSGTVVLDYAKVHICNFFDDGTEQNLEPGCRFPVVDLQYARGVVRIGVMICFDREFPESARCLAAQGAELILVPNSCDMVTDKTLGDIRLAQLRARAFENMVGIALANYPAPKNDGNSCGIDVDGSIVAQAGKNQELLVVQFDLERIRRWQQDEVWGLKNSRPDCYTKI